MIGITIERPQTIEEKIKAARAERKAERAARKEAGCIKASLERRLEKAGVQIGASKKRQGTKKFPPLIGYDPDLI